MQQRVRVFLSILLPGIVSAFSGCSELGQKSHQAVPQSGVLQSARDIPVLYDVDVVVVGGTSGAVTAAVAAAQAGASVFVAAPEPYLGEDICATYRLWLEPDEEPASALAQTLFAEPEVAAPLPPNAIPFTYETDITSSAPHRDTSPPSLLADGKWHSAPAQSVQYNGDVSIVTDFGEEKFVDRLHVTVYQRNNDFEVASVVALTSNDKQNWEQAGRVANSRLGQGSFEAEAIPLSIDVGRKSRYVKLCVNKTPEVERVLLGEIMFESQAQETPAAPYRIPPTPMHVKRTLDDALLNAGVGFLYGCYATDLLRDDNGALAGIVMANRSGRQAVRARVIIDATPRAAVARMAGAEFDAYREGMQTFKRIVIGGQPQPAQDVQMRVLPAPVYAANGRAYKAAEYTLEIPMNDGSFASFAAAEQIARDRTWRPGQMDASEVLFHVPPDRMRCKTPQCCTWPGAEKVVLDAFRPASIERLYVLGGCADVSRRGVEKMLRPLEMMRLGSRIGAAAAAEAHRTASPLNVRLGGSVGDPVAVGDVREDTTWMRAGADIPRIAAEAQAIPILGEYDVVVVGGGTGGAPAGIAAARRGARTLVVESLHGLGGIGTMGLIGKYYYGYREGFTKELDQGLAELGGEGEGRSGQGAAWDSQLKIEWYRRELRKAGADIWYGALGCGAFVHGNRVTGVIVATPQGRGVVLAKAVIDSTGSAAIAAAAGAECVYTSSEHVAVQGTGLPPWDLGARYTNTDYTFIDDIDVTDAWRSFLIGRKKFAGQYDLARIVDTRERRQIVGDFCLSPMDVYLGRTFPDAVVRASSNFDTHGFTIHPMFMLRPPHRKVLPCYVAYRCLLPQGLENILVTGLAVSAHRDVMPVIRMQPDIQNQGYAVGIAAAMAVSSQTNLRDIDVRALQQHLVEKGNLPQDVLTHADSFPLPLRAVRGAVSTVTNEFDGLEILFAQQEQALLLLRDAYTSADSQDDKLTYAHILGIWGDPTGADALAAAVATRQWDEGWKYTGMGQYGRSISEVDSLIIALGRTRRPQAMEPILEKVQQLGPEHAMSHHRAVALALETMREPAGAEPLADLLSRPGMRGHALTDLEAALSDIPSSGTDTSTRERSLRELILARALYRCGDHQGLGEQILTEYSRDLRGHYARHALAVLKENQNDR